ncbi:MAG TPA: 5-carboxymethyl-2-hydroxymuconate Delta-isomerase [Aliiroseovarius sp.]|nr:5-carboxymethyl-2-hydroxymuconate Delta-isomerase [Aliiroseovarius sp.]
MPHLSFEYSPGLENLCDLNAFASACRDALVATGACKPGGIRVRGFRADICVVADGKVGGHFLDMVLRLGEGRDDATRAAIADSLYSAAETTLRPALNDMPFILSLEVQDIQAMFSRKSWSTIHAALNGDT